MKCNVYFFDVKGMDRMRQGEPTIEILESTKSKYPKQILSTITLHLVVYNVMIASQNLVQWSTTETVSDLALVKY